MPSQAGPRAGVARQSGCALRTLQCSVLDEELGFYAYALDGEKKQGADVRPTPDTVCGPA